MTSQGPTIRLVDLADTVVKTPTQEEHNALLRVYEFGAWTWSQGAAPTSINMFDKFKELTYLRAENGFTYGHTNEPWIKRELNPKGRDRVITPDEFYATQRAKLFKSTWEDIGRENMGLGMLEREIEGEKREEFLDWVRAQGFDVSFEVVEPMSTSKYPVIRSTGQDKRCIGIASRPWRNIPLEERPWHFNFYPVTIQAARTDEVLKMTLLALADHIPFREPTYS